MPVITRWKKTTGKNKYWVWFSTALQCIHLHLCKVGVKCYHFLFKRVLDPEVQITTQGTMQVQSLQENKMYYFLCTSCSNSENKMVAVFTHEKSSGKGNYSVKRKQREWKLYGKCIFVPFSKKMWWKWKILFSSTFFFKSIQVEKKTK